MSGPPERRGESTVTLDWSKVKAFVDHIDEKSKRVPPRSMAPCQCGRMLKLGQMPGFSWNCGPACVDRFISTRPEPD